MPPRKRPATRATTPAAIPPVRPNKRARRPRLRTEGEPAGPYDQRPQVQFTSVSVPLSSRVSSKTKAKIWANEYINFGSLLSDSPQQEGKYSLSMTPSVAGSSSQPQLTLEPCHVSKKIANISQWVSAFNISFLFTPKDLTITLLN